MSAGRKPVPTSLKVIRGTDRADRRRREAKVAQWDVKRAPRGMSEAGRRIWHEIAPMLQSAGLLYAPDHIALRLICENYAQWIEYSTKSREGILVRAANNTPMLSPYFVAAQQAQNQLYRLLSSFGMTPADRSRIDAGISSIGKGAPAAPPSSSISSKYFKAS